MNNTKWTTEFPTKPGYYWIRNFLGKRAQAEGRAPDPAVYLTQLCPGKSFELDWFFIHGNGISDRDSIASAEWHGPVEPPE